MASYGVRVNNGAPSNGTSARQTITTPTTGGAATGGTFRLSYQGQVTGQLVYNITAANLQTALRALGRIGSDGVTVTHDGSPWVVDYTGALAKLDVAVLQIAANSITGPGAPYAISVAETILGVTATARGTPTGAQLIDTSTGNLYRNAGTATSPLWGPASVGTIALPIQLAGVTAADVLTNWTPGFAGRLLNIAFAVTVPVTTGSKAASLHAEIGAAATTGGVVALTSSNCTSLGAVVAGSTITGANTFAATDTLSIVAATVTTFVEGAGVLYLTYASS